VLAAPYDLGIILLGDDYLYVCSLNETVTLGGTTLLFCGETTMAHLPHIRQLRPIRLTVEETRRFACGTVGLKGEVAARLLRRLSEDTRVLEHLRATTTDLLELLEAVPPSGT
jgi:hypothetical protein